MRKNPSIDLCDEITNILTSAPDLNKSLTSVMVKAKAATGAETWSLMVDAAFKKIPLRSSRNIQKIKFETGAGLTGAVLVKGKPVIVQDVSKDKRFDKQADKFRDVKIRSLICVPLKIKDKPVGVLRLINKRRGAPFTPDDVKMLMNISYHAASVLEREYLYQKIEEISITDDLTGLYNIRYLYKSIEVEIERSRRYGSLFSIIFMDIDSLKKVNDRFGHLTGSKVLIETAGIIQINLRKVDVVIRYGGDEFVIILPQTPRDAGFLVAERLRKVIEKNAYLKGEGVPVRITASFGVASFPDDAKSKEELLRIADKAMYRGKFSTKNVVFAAK
ncbi:MAG: sensor domain-containing diguanylate cyclase [Nitrospirae bacterium]|nr:sensor domain-containing diguanylate cyclase [Nitrospirota bacterium]